MPASVGVNKAFTAGVYYVKNSHGSIFIITLCCMTTTSTNNIMTSGSVTLNDIEYEHFQRSLK